MNQQTTSTRFIPAMEVSEGAGVTVHRTIGTPALRNYDPFMMLDQFRTDNPDDYIAGFPSHPHNDMEIVTYIISGAIEHKDSMGNGTVIRAGEVQRMTAGTGVRHSEFNHSQDEELHLLQIWIFPDQKDLEPGYEQTLFAREDKLNRLRLIGSRDGRDGSVTIHQDVDLYASVLEQDSEVTLDDVTDRRIFVQVVSGDLDVNGEKLSAGDGAQIRDAAKIIARAESESEFLLFNLE